MSLARRSLLALPFLPRIARAQAKSRVVVVGGGFAGATAARALRHSDPTCDVVLVEPNRVFVACPFSNLALVGLRDMAAQQFGYDAVVAAGVRVVHAAATGIDPGRKQVMLDDRSTLTYDRAIIAPGIDIAWGALPGYDMAAAEAMPHAWRAGAQTDLLRRQLESMDDGGVVAISVPANPYRCPPGPYERASLIAWYLKTRKPRSKLLILDAKDQFSKQALFRDAWARLYLGIVEWSGVSDGGKVVEVDAKAGTLRTEFGALKVDVANVVPPQRAAGITRDAGLVDRSGWCPVDPITFESRLAPGIHLVGDSIIGGAMPKSAFAANAQAKACALAVAASLNGGTPAEPRLINTCYSMIAPDEAISVAGVYAPRNGVLAEIEGAGGTSPRDAPQSARMLEATYARAWFDTATWEVFG